jgi:predicted RNA-binding protein with PUA-like domain
MPWLLKTEPSTYSWSQLVAEKKATWDGVSNALALKHLREMKKGDLVLFYHTGDEKQVVVDLKPKRAMKVAVKLETIKKDPALAGWDLLRISRLSVVPTPEAMFKRIEELGT